MIVRGLREIEGVETLVDIFDITEFTYSGKDMGERSITATINHPSPIDFRAGDFVEFQMQSLERQSGGMNGTVITEKFYIYTMPTVKKTANPMTAGDAFEHTLTLYPAQYELALVQMRNLGDPQNPEYIYTGFDEVTFVGGASMLMKRIKLVLDEAYGKNTWTYKIANEVNEEINTSLETFLFTFSGNTVMDALLKLNDKDGINTTFYINDRTIYVGRKRPYFCRVLDNGNVDPDINTQMFNMRYGQTSCEGIAINYGGLFEITKSVGKETPITKLFAYGAARNLNRYYCSDRIKIGRYVNRLMLPSFDADGKTDFILSEKGIEKFGIREGSKQFEDIYPSLRYVNYGDIRQIKYCIKLKVSGLDGETKDNASFPLVRVQCYKVVPSDQNVGVNALMECAPPDDIAVYIHTLGSVVRVVLYGGRTNEEALAKQRAHDAIVPTRTKGGTDYIYGSCFAVHDRGFDEEGTAYLNDSRDIWFTNPNEIDTLDLTDAQKTEIELHQVTYFNTPAITDIYVFNEYHQDYFSRDGYSAWGWARLNANYVTEGGIIAHDSLMVNEIVAVEPIVIQDTEYNLEDGSAQQTFDIYLRDVGFKIDEQNDFGENVFVLNGDIKVSFLDGKLTGREFNVNGSITDFQSNCVCAFNDDGTRNNDFFEASGYTEKYIAEQAFADGAIWRLRLVRSNMSEPDLSNLALAMPTPNLNAGKGDHIVLLDLFMPDIYIHAAENRLLREARQYLEANDNGSISYSVEFDKVRMHQIPQYALQIREGLNVRVQDEDLSITTENDVRKVFEGELVSNTSLYKTTYDSEIVEKYYYTYEHRDYYDIDMEGVVKYIKLGNDQYISNPSTIYFKVNADGSWSGILYALESMIETDYSNPNYELFAENGKITVRLLTKHVTPNGVGYKPTDNYCQFSISNIKKSTSGGAHGFTANCYKGVLTSCIFPTNSTSTNDGQIEVYCIVEYDIKEKHPYDETQFTPNTHLLESGSQIYCPSKLLIEFRAKKHYAVEMELYNTNLMVLDNTGYPVFALVNNLGEEALIYKPVCEKMDMVAGPDSIKFKFEFDTIDGFNDSQDYYPAVLYKSDNSTEYIKTKLLSIVESDYEGNKDLAYADFVLDSVTIEVNDSSNVDPSSAPIKMISATLSEQKDASAWATLMNKVEDTVIEGEANSAAVENLVNSARKNYLSILSLRDRIFDPDGTCDQTFLQVMMMQIGADSMNYRMLKTSIDFNGKSHNCLIKNNVSFEAGSDTLYHYVYSQGAQGGTWEISALSGVTLNGTSVYYIALKCQREGLYGEWVCDTVQHKVDEDPGYWYFNWGILTCDSAGIYTLTETRGNAYMYGDNLVCGKISNLAKNCWFDLTNGDFVLGNSKSGAAFSYIDGVLNIGGLPTDSDVSDLLIQLGVLNNKLGNIGGENVLPQSMYHMQYKTYQSLRLTQLMPLEAGKTYVCTYGKFEDNATADEEWARGVCLVVSQVESVELIESVHRFNEPIDVNGNGRFLYIAWGAYDYVNYVKGSTPAEFVTNDFTQYLDYVMVQEGEVATSFQPSTSEILTPVVEEMDSYMYLKKALENDTVIAGGLIATSKILLKDWTGKYVDQSGKVYNEDADGREKEYKVNAGLSGVLDDNILIFGGGTYSEAVNAAKSENDYYKQPEKSEKIATLIKKDGTGKIGSFEIINNHTVSVNSSDGNSKIVISAGQDEKDTNIVINQGGDMKVLISGDNIEKNSIYGVELKGEYSSNATITNSTQDIAVKDIDLSSGTGNWSVNFNAKKLIISFGIAPLSSIHRVRCSFDVYLCGKRIATSNGLWTNKDYLDSVSVSQEVGASVDLIPFTSAQSTMQTLEVRLRNVEVYRGGEWSTDYNQKLYLSSIRMCTKSGDGTNAENDYVDDSILLTYASSIGIIQIGRNGIQVSHKNGGFVQILNDDSELYVRMFGLPTGIPSGNNIDGNIYNWNGFLRIAGNESTSIDFTELGYKKVVLPSHVIIPNMAAHNSGVYEANELNRWDDGDVFIG